MNVIYVTDRDSHQILCLWLIGTIQLLRLRDTFSVQLQGW